MDSAWNLDFSYRYFRQMARAIKANFESRLVSEVPRILDKIARPTVVLRHDMDVSPKRALRMAEIENEFGIRATYMVMTRPLLYSVEDKSSRDMLQQLINMGHEVGLHFDLDDNQRHRGHGIGSVEAKIYSACKQLESIIGQPVLSLSFHNPMPQFLRGPLTICGRVNAYSRELMAWYVSDSKGCWRDGEPLPKLLSPDKSLLQLLVHPIWWGDKHMLPEDRLQDFFDGETKGQSTEYIKQFDAVLANVLPSIRRKGLQN